MITKRKNQQIEMHLITMEDLVPMGHLLRKKIIISTDIGKNLFDV